MATFDNFISSLRSEFGEQGAGKKFEVFCKWFLENDPRWSKSIDKVWLWDDYPNKWQRQDLGTDLVFRDKEGLIWAVQAKCYSEHRATTKGDMNSFLADTGRKEVDRRLWIQTTNKMEAKADKTLKGQDKPVTVFNLNDFRDAQIDYPTSYAWLNQAKVKSKPTPDPHQDEAIVAVQSGLQTLDRGQMIMACGTGKTFTTLWIKEALKAHRTLVLLPSLSLLSQTMREWAWAGNTDFEILNVCSDRSVGKKTEDMEVSDAPFPVTSEPAEIAKFLIRPEPKVIFCTYQSSPLIAEVQLDSNIPTFDLTIADEAHRCAGKAEAGFATVLNADRIRSTKRLFTTATPRYFGAVIKDAAKARDLAVVGMDDMAVFGPVLHKLTFGQAIAKDLLNDYQVVIVGVDEPMVKQWIDEQEIVAINPDHQTDARTLAAKIGLFKAIKCYDLKRIISFHSRIDGAKFFSKELLDVIDLIDPIQRPKGIFMADYVSGKMKASERKDKIDRLKLLEGFDRGILSNSRCLAEGVDVPSLDGVAFIDPKGSQIEIIQAVGRAIRKVREAKVQNKGTIVIPVFIEAGDNPEASIEASSFKPVWDVLKALRAHDEILAETLDQYRTNMAKNNFTSDRGIGGKVVFDIPTTVDVEFSSSLRSILVEACTASWEFWFGLLEEFKDREGHCMVLKGHKELGYALATWVVAQRGNKNSLSLERIARLDSLGFNWDPRSEFWEEGLYKLKEFQEREGHCRVPKGYKEGSFSLGNWVGNQRKNKDNLTQDRDQRLNALGFVWDPYYELWEEGFSKLQEFFQREGNGKVPQGYKESNFNLGNWVSVQRKKKEILTTERIERLNTLGFIWDPQLEQWEEGFSKLQEFFQREKHCLVPAGHALGEFALGNWIGTQRRNKDNLSQDRVKRLNALGFVWDPHYEQWEEGFSKLQEFFQREEHCHILGQYQEGEYPLGRWVSVQRGNIDSLSPERIKRLNALGFVWDKHYEQWEEGFSKLQEFFQREKHCLVTQKHKEGDFKLGSWVGVQRRNKDNLTFERFEKLNSLGFIWDKLNLQWEEGFSKLQEFFQREKHCLVTQKHKEGDFKLGGWVGSQRKSKDNDSLSLERVERLDALGFVWEPNAKKWEEGFNKLRQFKEREGHCNVPKRFKESNFELGNWIGAQRTHKKKLSTERIRKLDAFEFVWDPRTKQWEDSYSKLQEFFKREGHSRVPQKHKEGDFNLGHWVGRQRLNKDNLSRNCIKRLDLLSFVWALNTN